MYKKHLWKSDVLHKDADQLPTSLFKISLFHKCFSHIFPHFAGPVEYSIFLYLLSVLVTFPLTMFLLPTKTLRFLLLLNVMVVR